MIRMQRCIKCLHPSRRSSHVMLRYVMLTGGAYSVDWEDMEMTCLPLIMRRGSTTDKMVYRAAMVGHRVICENATTRNRMTITLSILSFDVHCCRMGTAIKHPVPDRVKPSFVIFDIRAL